MTHHAWESALRPLLVAQRELYAVGGFRRGSDHRGVVEVLVDRLEVTAERPNGLTRPPLDDWVVFTVAHGPGGLRPDMLIPQLQPRQSQDLVILMLDGTDHRRWCGAFCHSGTILPVEGVQVIGPRMLKLSRQVPTERAISHEEEQRWSRTVGALGQDVHRKVRHSAVTIVGAGRNGSQTAFQLAAVGVGRLRLIDADVLAIENLDAMPGLTAANVGQPKVKALGRRLMAFRPNLSVSCLEHSITDPTVVAALRQRRSDLIISCVDHDTPRLAASLVARQTLTVHLDVGTSVQVDEQGARRITGDVRILLPGQGCAACPTLGGLADPEQTLYELSAPQGSLKRGAPEAWHEQRAGSLLSINAITVSTAVMGWLELLAGELRTSFWHRLRWVPGEGLEVHSSPVGAAAACAFCRGD